ncbi:MAG: nicotinate (nicotinamide) nucleotide adenylyltransferase [Bacteroidia bacterium]|nr:nicotinate (nicotinamide) nucleotide adenylyltransferase [Bacteroidia bacterium]
MPYKKNKKIALFFGSFNPIHIGHLAIANYFAEFTDNDEVWWVVSPQNPLKEKKTLLAQHHRLYMVNLAIEDYPKFKASDIEFHLPQPSYTIHTLVHLKEKYPHHRFSLILGQDNLSNFHKWKNYEVILEHYSLYVYPRPSAEPSQFDNHPNIHFTQAPYIEISSTFIRNAIKQKKDIRYFLHPKVWNYIDEMNFYKR